MNELQLLAAALGLGALSGISLYLTVFVVGMCIHFNWLSLSPHLQPLEVFANPWIWGIAAALYFIEFFADKVPWVDSLWDAIHTAVRPIGAMFLAAAALGQMNPALEIITILLTGGTALAVHTAKAGFRLVVNTSPEPVSNIVTSLAGDAVVVGGVALTLWNPWIMLAVVIAFLAAMVFLGPSLVRMVLAHLGMTLGKLTSFANRNPGPLPTRIGHKLEIILTRHAGDNFRIKWALPCWSARVPHTPSYLRGHLVALEGEGDLWFVGAGFLHETASRVPLRDSNIELEEKFLAHRLTFYKRDKGVLASFNISLRNAHWARDVHSRLGDILITVNAPEVEVLDGPALLGSMKQTSLSTAH